MHVDGGGAGALVVIEQAVGAALAAELRQPRHVEPVAVSETDVGGRNDQCPIVDAIGVCLYWQRLATRDRPHYPGAASLLREPHVRVGGEFEFTQEDFPAVAIEGGSEVAMAAMAADALGITAISSASAPTSAAKALRTPFHLTHPAIPWRAVGVPRLEEGRERGFDPGRQRALGAAIQVDAGPEDWKAAAELVERVGGRGCHADR